MHGDSRERTPLVPGTVARIDADTQDTAGQISPAPGLDASAAALPNRRSDWRSRVGMVPVPLLVGLGTFLLYALTLPEYQLRVTDLSAWRVAGGDVPYRDFWTMYAPGSFLVLGWLFAAVGQELIVSRVVGMITSAAAVAVFFRLTLIVSRDIRIAILPTAVFAAALFGTGYYANFSSYAPVILLIWLAVGRLARFSSHPAQRRDLVVAGCCLGVGIVFKHDIAGYALLVAGLAIVATRRESEDMDARRRDASPWRRHTAQIRAAVALWLVAVTVAAIPYATLAALGAGPDMVRDLVIFPLTDFRHVRGEYFPIVPRLRPDLISNVREAIRWTTCNVPTIAIAAGLLPLWRARRRLAADQRYVLGFTLLAFPLYWTAAHVQVNTHAVTLAGIGALVAAAGVAERQRMRGPMRGRSLAWACLVVAVWCAIVCLERGYILAQRVRSGTVPVALPRLTGISMPPDTVRWMRGLAREIEAAAEPSAPLLVLGNRNDMLVFADTTPYWLSNRRSATRYHELHPAITDTEVVQREMLSDLARQPLPVLIREHRFDTRVLDGLKRRLLGHVPVGATLLDDWVAANYLPGPRFGMYEVMRPRVRPGRESTLNATEVPSKAD